MRQLLQPPGQAIMSPFNLDKKPDTTTSWSLSRYMVCTYRGRLGKKGKRKTPRDRKKRANERSPRGKGEIFFLFTNSRYDKKQSSRLLVHNGAGSGDSTHTFTHYLPSSVSCDYTEQIQPKTFPSICVCPGDIWGLVICSQFHISLLFLFWPAAVLTGSSSQ